MFKPVLPLCASLLMLGTTYPVSAAAENEAWTPGATSLRANGAGVSLPQTVGELALHKSGEASHGGEGIDNYAQYLSEDGEIQATLYVYLPGYADVSLATYMTDKAIMARFGERTRRSAYASVPLGGQKHGAIRAVYDDAADGALTTAAAFAHAGRWLVKLRVTGPSERRKEVLAGLDAMLQGLKFDDPAAVKEAEVVKLSSCPAGDGADAHLTERDGEAAVIQASDGKQALCMRGMVSTANGAYEMFQSGGMVIVPVDDAGTMLTLNHVVKGEGYQLAIHSLGKTDFYGVYDKVPNAKQIAAILDGKDPATAQARMTRDYAVSR